MTCKHESGDFVNGYWLCAQCFHKLENRPVRYAMKTASFALERTGDKGGSHPAPRRQEIVWRAIAPISSEGITFGKFIMLIAERFVRKGRVDKESAVTMAIASLQMLHELGDVFGDKDSTWDRDAAYSIADEEMSYWEDEGPGGN